MLYDIVIENYELRPYLGFFAAIIDIIDLTIKSPPPPVLRLFEELFFLYLYLISGFNKLQTLVT